MKTLTPPTTAKNLTAWFVCVPPGNKIPDYSVLEEAMEKQAGLIHETGDVNELLIENPGDTDLFIQAGDIVKGGRHDAGKSIDFSYFGGTPAWPGFIHLLGLVEVDDPRILNPDQDKIDLRIQHFEEYANGGMSIMLREMEGRDFTLDSILSLLPPATISSDSGELATQI